VRQDEVIRSQAVRIAIGINDEGRRQILAVDLANRESQTSWRDVLLELKSWGLNWVVFMLSDDHPGLAPLPK
jgi:putative transposase